MLSFFAFFFDSDYFTENFQVIGFRLGFGLGFDLGIVFE